VTPLYALEAIRKSHGAAFSLDLPALEIPEGGIHVLAGPNGSGKSTLLSLLAFLDRPDGGRIRFGGLPVAWNARALTALRRQATLLHQSPWLFRGTVFENVAWGLGLRGTPADAARRRVGDALAAVGLAGFERRDAAALSGGEAQRAAMARAIAIAPRVMLLDEPFSGVDAAAAAAAEALIASMPARGTTVLLTTHDPAQAVRLGANVIRLAGGRLAPTAARPVEPLESGSGARCHAVV
jgi:tungstate transport system ATP-binding protein